MKKFIFILIALIGLGISANAQTAEITKTETRKDGVIVYFKVHGIYKESGYNGGGVQSVTVKVCAQTKDIMNVLGYNTCDYKEYSEEIPSNPSQSPAAGWIKFSCDTEKLNRCGIYDFNIKVTSVVKR
jgi:hypothetical protein